MKVIDSCFNSCINKFTTSSRYEFVITITFYFVSNIDSLIWSLMRFRWIFKIAIFRRTIFFEKFFEFVSSLLHFNYLTQTRFEFALNLSRIISFSSFFFWRDDCFYILVSRVQCTRKRISMSSRIMNRINFECTLIESISNLFYFRKSILTSAWSFARKIEHRKNSYLIVFLVIKSCQYFVR